MRKIYLDDKHLHIFLNSSTCLPIGQQHALHHPQLHLPWYSSWLEPRINYQVSPHHLLFTGSQLRASYRQDKEHHGPTFDQFFPLSLPPYPSNVAIKSHSMLPNAREAEIHNLQGLDPIWAGTIISDRSQD